MLFGPELNYLHELEINGEHVDDGDNEDFTNEKPEDNDENIEDADDEVEDGDNEPVDDDLEDFTDEEFVDDEDDEPVDDETVPEDDVEEPVDDDLEDYTGEEFEDGDDNTGAEEPDTGEEEPVDDGDDLQDFTDEDFEDGAEDPDAEGDNPEGADDSGEGGDSADNANPADSSNGNTLADMEKNLFSDLSPQQLSIKNNELLQNYIDLYETINTIFDNINKIPKTYDNTRPLTFIADQLIELKDMVNYAITTTYITRTYVENMAYYKQALLVLEQLNTMLKALVKKPTK